MLMRRETERVAEVAQVIGMAQSADILFLLIERGESYCQGHIYLRRSDYASQTMWYIYFSSLI